MQFDSLVTTHFSSSSHLIIFTTIGCLLSILFDIDKSPLLLAYTVLNRVYLLGNESVPSGIALRKGTLTGRPRKNQEMQLASLHDPLAFSTVDASRVRRFRADKAGFPRMPRSIKYIKNNQDM